MEKIKTKEMVILTCAGIDKLYPASIKLKRLCCRAKGRLILFPVVKEQQLLVLLRSVPPPEVA